MSQTLVLPVRPGLGWRRAGDAQRVLALAVVPLVVGWTVLLARAPGVGDVLVLVSAVTVGPPAFWSLARVVRPHLDDSVERLLRHALAAAATCFGTVVVVGIATDTEQGDFLGLFAGLASLGFVVTVPWGLVALVARSLAVARPLASRPTHARTPLPR